MRGTASPKSAGSERLKVTQHPSPNHGPRKSGPVYILLLHYTGMKTADAALERLCDPEASVSSHFFVDEDGKVLQLVGEDRRAWHAGLAYWAGERDINSRSIGIEIHNPGHEHGYRPFPDRQIEAVAALCGDVLTRHDIPPHRVLAHSDVAPDRKEDPGELFPWEILWREGVGHWVRPAGIGAGSEETDISALQRKLAAYGYPVEQSGVFDDQSRLVVTAFQRHFRPGRVDGEPDASTVATLTQLLLSARDLVNS